MIKKIIAALIISAVLLLCGCAREISEPPEVTNDVLPDLPPELPEYPVSFDDETFEARPASVASLSPSLTEILCDIGAGDVLVGVSDYCDRPEAQSLERIGSPAKPDVDALCELSPELLVTSSPIAATDRLRLREAGIRIIGFDPPESYAQLVDVYLKLSMIFNGAAGYSSAAQLALSQLDASLSAAYSLGLSYTLVIVEDEAPEGLMLSPANTLSSDILSVFGRNLWDESQKFTATEEELLELAPDLVFYASGLDKDKIEEEFPHSKLISVDFSLFERPSARLAGLVGEVISRLE